MERGESIYNPDDAIGLNLGVLGVLEYWSVWILNGPAAQLRCPNTPSLHDSILLLLAMVEKQAKKKA